MSHSLPTGHAVRARRAATVTALAVASALSLLAPSGTAGAQYPGLTLRFVQPPVVGAPTTPWDVWVRAVLDPAADPLVFDGTSPGTHFGLPASLIPTHGFDAGGNLVPFASYTSASLANALYCDDQSFNPGCGSSPYSFVQNFDGTGWQAWQGKQSLTLLPGGFYDFLFGTFVPQPGGAPPGRYFYTFTDALVLVDGVDASGEVLYRYVELARTCLSATDPGCPYTRFVQPAVTAPEPASLALLATGLVALLGVARRRRHARAAGTLAALLVVGCSESESVTEPLPDTREPRVVFVSNRDGNFEVYSMNADGTNPTRLTNTPAAEGRPAWSPDGKQVAFTSERDGNRELYVMNADGTSPRNLSAHPGVDDNPSWSPDGRRIAFSSTRDGNAEIYVVNADGTGLARLTSHAATDTWPVWSPDGRRIAFQANRDGASNDVYVMSADGTGVTRLTTDPAIDQMPAWSADGARLVFMSAREGNPDVFVMGADGSGQTNLTRNPATDARPSWARNGQITFMSTRDGNMEIYVMNADGTGATRLTSHPMSDDYPFIK